MRRPEIDFVTKILREVHEADKPRFTGVGLILYDDLNSLPVTGLRQSAPKGLNLPYTDKSDYANIIIRLNSADSDYHDGFHLLSKEGLLTHLCQYFSPPINGDVHIDYSKGGRFRAAQYGSCMEQVLAIGVIGQDYGPYIFIKGVIIQL